MHAMTRIFHTVLPERRLAAGFSRSEHAKPVTDRRSTPLPVQSVREIGGLTAIPPAESSAPGPAVARPLPGRGERRLKIFFSGGLGGSWMSGWQRCRSLENLGHEITPFSQDDYVSRALLPKPLRLLTGRQHAARVVEEFNRDILAALLAARPDIAWLEWPMLLCRETLAEAARRLPGCRWVSFQDDNPFGSRPGERRRWQYFLEAIPHYDLHLVKRESDLAEFARRGARHTQRFQHGFFAPLFRPVPEPEIPGGLRQEVCFVGTPLDHRVAAISDLLVCHRLPLRVYGGRWNRTLVYHRRKACFRPPVQAEDYVRVICGSRISLGFVSSSNRDEYTMRTFEIPACRGFLLAERTPAHEGLFREGREAEFFGSTEECADKIRFYLKAETARRRIAEAGYRRCLDSDYSLQRSMAGAVAQIQLIGK
jgi:spore maturation protein CgeB